MIFLGEILKIFPVISIFYGQLTSSLSNVVKAEEIQIILNIRLVIKLNKFYLNLEQKLLPYFMAIERGEGAPLKIAALGKILTCSEFL